ncbi:Protein N-acetyltransferase, RimJ/RimL family [Devosia enhydra]|uniref:Protein N-acetyltransferase, RimJ/RimL family n=1 Tax=Devosia enhydra TaxID=665118 RepID=A0A1K2HVK0_9HYPH|nr:GNAT family N-acetyltransferase [Devosia enhydra]SFZ82799.1 Protein N-acetyltransferase, RimJ/RimL family [Devosia enhydra]
MILETDHLLLRPWREEDRAPFARMVGDPVVMRFYTRTRSRADADLWIDKMRQGLDEGTSHFLAAEQKSDGAFVGLIGTAAITHALPGNPHTEIGWIIDKPFWGKGFAPEGARAHLHHAWYELGRDEVVAFTYRGNLPSQKVMEKIGMSRDLQGDFDHPAIAPSHPIRPHVLYRAARPA